MNTELENRLAALSPDQIKALVQRVNKGAGPAQTGLQKVARQPGQRHPLSSAQERLWFLSQLSPESRVFNNPGALRAQTTAPLKRELFERSLNEVGRRHEILRTTFHSDDGKPVQEIHEHIDLRVGWQDISELPPEQREREAERIAIAEGRQTFDLATGPLITMKILRLGDLDYLLLITSHHIVSDGWSMAMFATEVASIYNAFENQRPHDLREPDLQFVDCVYRERDWMQGEKFRQHLDYWKQQLRAEPPPLALPTDHPRPRTMSDAGAMEKLMLSTTQAERLRTLAKQEGSSLFQVLIAAFKVLLSRYTGQEDIVVGTLAANRNRREFQNVMGLFMNTLPIRTHVSGDQTFREYLRSVQLVCQEALIHQELPFEKLIGELNPRRNLNTHPLFQVMFVHQNVPTLYVVPGMRLELFKVDYRTSKFDLNLWVEEINEELLLTLYYAEALFNPSTIKRMLSHYQTLLESVVADPATPIKHLPYFSRAERDFVLQRTHVSESLPSTRECFQRRFELQAERCPGSVAVECLDARLTYGQLNSQANQLARHLQRLQVGPGSLVAVLMERHPRTVVGLMGVMKAGGAYVPLDPTHPAGRIETILKNSETGVLVTEERFRSTVASLPVKAIYLDSEWSDIAENSDDNLDIELPDNQLVYVMYTSGTTGRPKGVCVEHRNLVNYCDAIWREMKLSQAHSFTTVSSLAADLGNTMIFPPLANGARVVIVPQDLATDAVGLATYFKERPVDCLKIVPSHLRALLKSSQARHILPAKLLMVGGEACPSDLVETIQGLNPSCRLLNHYGPTEGTIGVLTYGVPEHGAGESNQGALPLGFPLAGCRVYVLDKEQQPVPIGISGEIYIGGANVARGYLNQPELSAERFVPNPFVDGDRLYKTGDKAKLLEDGAIAFLGRIDRQVKIRGFRVELSEIESALSQHVDVERAVILPLEEGDPRQQLVAVIQAKRDSAIDAEMLKEYLRSVLPSYMIPGRFVFAERMPLTPNGKIDYQALSRYEMGPPETSLKLPRDQIELELALIWKDLIGVDSIGDNFFDAGGHSLLGVQLMAKINETFGNHLPLASLFEYSTIEEMAKLLREKKVVRSSPLVCIQPKGGGSSIFFVHPAGGNVLCYYELARSLGSRFPFYGLQAVPSVNGDHHGVSIASMARLYHDAVLAAHTDQPPIFGGWSMGALVAFEIGCIYAREHNQLPIIAVLDQVAPGTNVHDSHNGKNDDLSRLLSFSKKVSQLIGKDLGVTHTALSGRTPEEHAAVFLNKFKAAQLVPENTSVQDFQGFLKMMITHNRITAEYSPGVYAGKIVVFRAEESISFDSELDEATRINQEREPDLGWQKYTSQPVDVIPVPGNHVSMITNPNVQVLAEKLATRVVSERIYNHEKDTPR